MMALDLNQVMKIICPLPHVATAEVIGLLGLNPVMVDVNEDTLILN
jgi:dTDP-4-amino-4,6-dideoxygalactose transaminase